MLSRKVLKIVGRNILEDVTAGVTTAIGIISVAGAHDKLKAGNKKDGYKSLLVGSLFMAIGTGATLVFNCMSNQELEAALEEESEAEMFEVPEPDSYSEITPDLLARMAFKQKAPKFSDLKIEKEEDPAVVNTEA